ncbi:hypothetical protein ACFO5R_14515 [Halosolutus amylolyticus]|uniref:Uncharacterized protein n=1 Tax=Halosolutus amylolyticus TaxID=2932267 RepID=A0ABD5PS55_9EURY|nr:hypothetical protein [Halosolutus amylolyticus]
MESPLAFLLVAVLAVQLPIAVLVAVDARRLGLANPERYELGILVPAGGLVVILVYLSRRRELPREAED